MVIVLLLAAFVSALFGEWADSGVIAVVILLNAALALYQEGRAERAVAALSALNAPRALVLRDGIRRELPAAELVVGDVVEFGAGDVAPADLRLLAAHDLQVDQSSLTGESLPVEKSTGTSTAAQPADCCNMLYLGSPIVRGHGRGLVTACGADTQTGRIAGLLAQTQSVATPLQKKLAELSRQLSIGVGAICALIFLVSLLATADHSAATLLDLLMLAISLAVAAIPEGLVVVVTLVLALGMNAIAARHGVIRRLAAVETLGATQVICSDKTGTLTENRMTVAAVWQLSTAGLRAAALANALPPDWQPETPGGDPTERALAAYAAQQGYERAALLRQAPLLAELPFDSRRKLMSTLHDGRPPRQYSKGAPELLLACCDRIEDESGRLRPLTAADRQQIAAKNRELSGQALRVLAVAWAERAPDEAPREAGLVFAGLLGLIDPPRPAVKQAVAAARKAGIRTVMVSGDSPDTARAVARMLGIWQEGQRVISGAELDRLDETALQVLAQTSVFARVKPEDKLRIVRAWQARGLVTAMTGDGVNDAPALKAADIGVAMGKNGSEVSRRVADLVLTDDRFDTILSTVAEGRRIYANIRKALQFLLSSNLAEVIAVFIAALLGIRLLLPIHLLWINLITDCFPAVALGLEQAEPGLMTQPPRSASAGIFSGGLGGGVVRHGAAVAGLTLLSFWLGQSASAAVGMTMAFLTLSAGEIFQAWNMRSRDASILTLPTRNRVLRIAMIGSLLLNLLLLYLPPLAALFSVTALNGAQLLTALSLGFLIVPLVEADKMTRRAARRKGKRRAGAN